MEPNERKKQNVFSCVWAHCNVPVVITSCIILTLIAIITTLGLLWGNITEIAKIDTQQVQGDIEEVEEPKVYSIYMMLNELSTIDNTQLAGNKISVTPNSEELTISFFNAESNEQINDEQGVIEVPEEGIKLKIDGIKEGESYDIEIENKETITDYEQTFKKATIEVDATQAGELEAYVKDITKEKEGQEETAQGSEENTAIFAYEEENGRIKIKGNKDVEIYYIISYNDAPIEGEIEEQEENKWKKYDPETGIEIQKNGTLYAKSKYKDGKYSGIKSLTINNIDKLEPSITVTKTEVNETKDEATVEISMQDATATDAYGKSEIYGYAITRTTEKPDDFILVEESKNEPITAKIGGITKDGTYYAWVSDKAGNTKYATFQIKGLTEEEEKVVAIMLQAPEKGKDLIGKEYNTLTKLMEALDTQKITAEDGQVVVQMVADVKNDSTKIANKNILLDLNGYTITSKLQEPTLKVESGNLIIVDNKYDIANYIKDETLSGQLKGKHSSKKESDDGATPCKGSVCSENYVAIQIGEQATVTLGENEDILAEPDTEAPFIKGGLKGVFNLGGVFNFYDGQIQGKVPVEGKITDTPLLYESTLTKLGEDGIFKDILQKVSGIEAKIGTTKYTKIEEAIEDANNKVGTIQDQIEIDVVAEITKDKTIVVDNTKNILLDLNGFTVTNGVAEVVIENYGRLEIIDSAIKEEDPENTIKGKIYSNSSTCIYNEEGAHLKLTSGTINSEAYAITMNYGTFEIYGGNITNNPAYGTTAGIENGGEVIMLDGTISFEQNYGGYSYGIDMCENGELTITGGNIQRGNIQGGNIQGDCAINNDKYTQGKITITGGNISPDDVAIKNEGNTEVIIDGQNSLDIGRIYNNGIGEMLIKNVEMTGTNTTLINNSGSGNITIEEVDISVTGTENARIASAISNTGEGNITIQETNITITSEEKPTNYKVEGIYNSGLGSITLKGVNITSEAYGIYNEGTGRINTEGENNIITAFSDGIYNNDSGEITIKQGVISSTASSGIYNKTNGIVVIGEKDGTLENEKVAITGTKYGVVGNIKYYDGIIKGQIEAIKGTINDTEEAYNEILLTEEDGVMQVELGKQANVAYVGEEETTYYNDLESAINACNENDKITLVKDITITTPVTIAEDKKITLNLNGKEVRTFTNGAIINKGEFNVTDELTDASGRIYGNENIIKNEANGKLTITKGEITLDLKNDKEEQEVIENRGTLKILGGKINVTADSVDVSNASGVHNIGGQVTIEGGVIHLENSVLKPKGTAKILYGIYNEEAGTITMQNMQISLTSPASSMYGVYNSGEGEIDIKSGEISSSRTRSDLLTESTPYGVYNSGEGNIKITTATISSKADNSYSNAYGICNVGEGSITIEDKGTITAYTSNKSAYGIYNEGIGKVTIKDGSISSSSSAGSSYGIYNKNNGTIEVGIKEDSETDTDMPKIEGQPNGAGQSYGVYNESAGAFNFYDGRIVGGTSKSIYGIVSDWADDYNIVKYKHGESEKYEVLSGREIAVLEKVYIARLTSNNQEYTSLEKAISAISGEADTITLILNTTINERANSLEISQDKDITLDLAGHTITASNNNTIKNNGKLHIKDTADKKGSIVNETGTIVLNNEEATLEIQNTTLTSRNYGKAIENKGTLNIQGSNISIENAKEGTYNTPYNAYAIYNEGEGVATITEGTISASTTSQYSNTYGIYNEGTGQITINGGKISSNTTNNYSNAYGIYNASTSKVTIHDENITVTTKTQSSNSYAIYDEKTGEVEVEGGTISSSSHYGSNAYGIYNKDGGNIVLGKEDGSDTITITARTYAIYNESAGTITVRGKVLNNPASDTNVSSIYGIYNNSNGNIVIEKEITVNGTIYGIYNNSNGKVTVQGNIIVKDEVKSTNARERIYAIYNNSVGEIVFKEGKISLTATGTSTYKCGIYNKSTGITTIGEKGNTVEDDKATITGATCGIYGNIKFYDGTITGEKAAIVGTISEKEENYEIVATKIDSGEQVKLGTQEGIAYVGDLESQLYNDLQSAVNACEDESESKITLVKDFTMLQELTIGENKKITLNLNGKEIRTYATITNNGEFILTDETSDEPSGKIYGNTKILKNEADATLRIQKGTIELKNVNSQEAIENKGTLEISDGEISVTELTKLMGEIEGKNYAYIYGINNSGGNTTISGGSINLSITSPKYGWYPYGIYNNENGTVKMSGGSISTYVNSLWEDSYGDTYGTDSIGIYNESGVITLIKGNISGTGSSSYGIWNAENGTVNLGEDTENLENTINISAETGIYNEENGNVTVKYGTINCTDTGIENEGVLTLGDDKDKKVNIQIPSIAGENYGISNDGTFNFYDGIVKGEWDALSGDVTSYPEGYEVKYYDLGKIAMLGTIGDFDNSIKVGDTFVDSLSTAVTVISNTTDKTGTIEINENIVDLEEAITIPEEVDITIALQGNEITYKNTNVGITNNGTLKIISYEDTTQSATDTSSLIKNENGTVIDNKGTLIIGQDNVTNAEYPRIEGKPAINGKDAQVKSGKIVGGTQSTIEAYRTFSLSLNNGEKVLSLDPEMTSTPKEWTKNNVNANINADIIPILNLYSKSTLEAPAQVIVHHYIYDAEADTEEEKYTTIELVGAETKIGIIGQEYTTSVSSEVPKNYMCVDEHPEGYTGTYGTGTIEVNYYYKLTTPSIEKSIEKVVTLEKNEEGEAVLTREDGEVPYTITYNTTIRNYIGKATITIVDTLPAKIDQTKSELDGGVYNESDETQTITWTKEVEIDTFKDGDYTEEIEKEITLVYKDQDVTQELVNAIKGETITYYPEGHLDKGNQEFEKEEIEDNVAVKQDYKVNFKVIKEWDDDEDLRGDRPESVTVTITVDQAEKSITQELNEENNWTYEEKGLQKYNKETGEKITYTVEESETEVGDLECYNEPEITNTETQTDEVTNYNYTITNTYKLKEVDLNAEISKTGTEEITTKEDKISYTIKFTAEVPDYVGKGTITIVDKLPFAIDEENSTLDEGVYNEAKRTITWEEERDIDTEELGESYKIDMTKEIELAYKGVDLTQEKMTNNVIGKVKLEATDEVDVDSTGCDTNINVEGKVTIRYVDKETGEDILGTENEPYTYEITGKIGSTYNAEIKEIEGYNYVDEGKATGTIQEEEQEIVLYYISNEARVIVKYQDKEGNKIAEDKIIEGHIGESYKTEAKQIENYRYIETKGEEEGTITEKETIVIYVYEKIATGKVTVRYVDQDTEKDIEKINPDDSTITNYTYEITGNIGEEYETEQKEIPYYIYVRSTENTKGTIKEGTDTVIYYYRKQVFNFSIEKTLAGVTLNGQEVQIKDNKLAKIELKPSEIENTSVIADYKIKVTNKGELAGTAKVVDKLPEGYKGLIVPDYWKENGDGTLEAEVELGVGESKELTITLIWENSEENLGPKSNKAELVGGENLANYEDTNKDDDISEATIVISIKTGETVSIIILIMLTISCIISEYLIFWVAPRKGKESNIKDIRFLNK